MFASRNALVKPQLTLQALELLQHEPTVGGADGLLGGIGYRKSPPSIPVRTLAAGQCPMGWEAGSDYRPRTNLNVKALRSQST